MVSKPRRSWARPLSRVICLIVAASALSGCIVAPYPGYYRPHRYYYY